MNRFSDAGSTPAVSSPEGREAKLGLLEVKNYGSPTTVEFARCMGYSIGSAIAELGYVYFKSNQHSTTMEHISIWSPKNGRTILSSAHNEKR